jgi:hypothetical protein
VELTQSVRTPQRPGIWQVGKLRGWKSEEWESSYSESRKLATDGKNTSIWFGEFLLESFDESASK